jgi:hypothetical protein
MRKLSTCGHLGQFQFSWRLFLSFLSLGFQEMRKGSGKRKDKGTDGGGVRLEVRMIRLIPCVPGQFLSGVAGHRETRKGSPSDGM